MDVSKSFWVSHKHDNAGSGSLTQAGWERQVGSAGLGKALSLRHVPELRRSTSSIRALHSQAVQPCSFRAHAWRVIDLGTPMHSWKQPGCGLRDRASQRPTFPGACQPRRVVAGVSVAPFLCREPQQMEHSAVMRFLGLLVALPFGIQPFVSEWPWIRHPKYHGPGSLCPI